MIIDQLWRDREGLVHHVVRTASHKYVVRPRVREVLCIQERGEAGMGRAGVQVRNLPRVSRTTPAPQESMMTSNKKPDKYFEQGGLIHRERFLPNAYYYVPCQMQGGGAAVVEPRAVTCLGCVVDRFEYLHAPKYREW